MSRIPPQALRTGLSLFLASVVSACAAPQTGGPASTQAATAPVEVGIIAINDFHGALEPPRAAVAAPDGKGGIVPVPAGGAAWLATAVEQIKAGHPNHVVVAAGDLTSASQLASSLHLDEPAIGVMNRIGLEFNAVGNHEFDRGWKELQRLQNGGCEKNTRLEPCQLEQFTGANFKYLSASTFKADGSTLFPATGLKSFGKGKRRVTVGFVGLSLKDVPQLVSPDQLKGLTFGDEAQAINTAVPTLRAQGADAVVVLIHQGGKTTQYSDPNGCDELTGAIRPILDRLEPGVDVVVSGHTHWQYVCRYQSADGNEILLTSAGVYGKLVTDITLSIDPASRRVIASRAHNVIVQSVGFTDGRGNPQPTPLYPQFAPDPEVSTYVQRYVDDAKDLIERPVGRISGPAAKPSGESWMGGPLGNMIADSQVAAASGAGSQMALMNPFGIRAPLDPAADGSINFGQIYKVQPFNNTLITMSLTGAQIRAVFEEGLDDDGAQQVLAPSAGVKMTFDMGRPAGKRVVSLTLNGKPIDPAARYRVTVLNFLAEGGDGYTTFTKGTDRVQGMIDNEAFQQWIAAVPVRDVPQENRTVQIGQ